MDRRIKFVTFTDQECYPEFLRLQGKKSTLYSQPATKDFSVRSFTVMTPVYPSFVLLFTHGNPR